MAVTSPTVSPLVVLRFAILGALALVTIQPNYPTRQSVVEYITVKMSLTGDLVAHVCILLIYVDSLSLSASLNELPNLPGVRRNPAQMNPKLYKQYMSVKKEASVDSLQGSQSLTHFDDPEYFSALSATLKPFPSSGSSFNDIGGRYSLRSQQRDRERKTKALPYSNLDNAPSFVTNKEQICSFTASFEDFVPENLAEQRRVRIVEIIVRTVDNTIEIREPVIPNSGLMQGKLLRRHQIRKPTSTPEAPEYYTIADFYAGAVVTIYNRDYTILDCTSFTRQFLANKGIDFGCPIGKPNSTDSRRGEEIVVYAIILYRRAHWLAESQFVGALLATSRLHFRFTQLL